MPNQRSKVSPSVSAISESSTKGYMRETFESLQKRQNRNGNEGEQEKKRSPLKSPRLCEEELEMCSSTDFYSQREPKQSNYHPQKYDDQVLTQLEEKETYFHNLPHDINEHKPRPPSGSSTAKKSRKQRLVGPQTSKKYEECLGKAKRANENKWVSESKWTAEENVLCKHNVFEDPSKIEKVHKTCKMQLSVKEKEIDKLKGQIEKLWRPYEAKLVRYEENQSRKLKEEQKKAEQLFHQNKKKEDELKELQIKYTRLRKEFEEYKKKHEVHVSAERENKISEHQKEFEKMYQQNKKFKKVNDALSEKKYEMEHRIRKLHTKLDHLERVEETHQLCLEREEEQSCYIKDLECKIEAHENSNILLQKDFDELNYRLEEFKSKYYTVQSYNKNVWEHCSDLKRKLEDQGNELEIVNGKLDMIKILSKECEKERRIRESGEHEMTKLGQAVQKKKREVHELNSRLEEYSKKCSVLHRDKVEAQTKISALTDALNGKERDVESLTNQLERYKDLSKEITNIKQDKENAEYQISSLSKTLFYKEKELESVQNKLARSEENVLILSQDVKYMQASKRLADEKLQGLQAENTSLTSALAKAKHDIDVFLKIDTNLQKYKTDAEHKISTLMNALKEKETKIEDLRKELARAEENVSILSQDIKNIQESKHRAAEENLQSLQTENYSLRSALSKAAIEYKDLSKDLTNLNQDKEKQISSLSKTLFYKEKELESVQNKLARSEENVLILSQDVKDMQASKRLADEKLQSLQTENTSLTSALAKAKNDIDDFLKKDTNLQKYKTDAEHKTSTLMNALKEKETKIEDLRKELARIEGLSNKDTNLQKYKTDAEHKTSMLMNALREKETEIEELREQLARSEENVSSLSKDIKNNQEFKHQVANQKLQDLQTENESLKLTLAEATTEIDDLWNKCTDLQKNKSDTDLEIRTLLSDVEEKEIEIETLHKHLARSEKNVSVLSKDIKDIQGSNRQAADEKVQGLEKENISLQIELAEATTENDALRNKCTQLQKSKTDAGHKIDTLLNAVKEKEIELETLKKQLARYEEKISSLTEYVEDIQGSKNQAADERIKGLQKKIDSLESELKTATTGMNELSRKYKHLQKDKENAEYKINNLAKTVQERDKEIDSLVEEVAMANKNVNTTGKNASADVIQKLKEDNASLQSDLIKQRQEMERKVSDLTKEIKHLQKSKGTGLEEYNARKLYDENEFLKAQLDRTSRSYEQLRKDYNEVKREKDHALNRLSSVAGEKLRNNNPGIADLSDENRPINLGEKFSQLYDDQWTDAIEHLEEMGYSETDGIRRLLDILKAVFDECVRLSDIHFNQLKELTGTSHLPSDQLKKLKDLRKATAVHSVAKIKQVVNDYMSTAFSKEKAACQTYIDRSIELCWLMSVQDPPVVIDFIAVHGQAIDDKILRKFTKTGSKIDFLVWPVIRLHKNGPLLQKGVVQPI